MSYTLMKLSQRYQRIHDLIKRKATGNAKEFAKKMGISEATLYNCLKFIKDQGVRLSYDDHRQTYFYEESPSIRFFCGFEKTLIDT